MNSNEGIFPKYQNDFFIGVSNIKNEEILENVSGGNIIKKSMPVILAISMMGNCFGKDINIKSKNETPKISISEKLKKFFNDNGKKIASISLTEIITALSTAGIVLGVPKLKDKINSNDKSKITEAPKKKDLFPKFLNDTNTKVNNMSETEVKNCLKSEIEKFESISSKFHVSEDAIEKIDNRILLLLLCQMNEIFGKYPNITKSFVNNCSDESVFSVDTYKNKVAAIATFVRTSSFKKENTSITFNPTWLEDLEEAIYSIKISVRSSYNCKVDYNKLVQSIAAHEMGHLIQYTIIKQKINNPNDEEKNKYLSKYNDYKGSYNSFLNYMSRKMKKSIVEIAEFNEPSHNVDINISTYGNTNEREWFAEVFSYACCNDSLDYLGNAMIQYIENIDKSIC